MSLSRSEQNELKERLKSQRRERHIKEPKNRISLDRGVTKLSELTRSDRKYIENLYVDLTKDISDEMRRLSITPQTNTVKLEKFRLTQLQKSVDRELAHIRDETQTRIMSSMTMAAQSVSQSNVDWLSSMGLKFYHTPAAVPADVIANLVSGKVYADNWEFSKRIWGDYRQSKGDLANIIAKGIAAGKSTYDIAVDLQTYVNPKAAKPWDWSKVYPHSKKKIDYNAQRLARTMTAHAYQQSVIETSKANPFVYTVQWRSAMEHNRTCLICEQRNGNIYPLDNVPLDHPNGLCTIFPVIQGSLKDVASQLADWVNGNADERFEKKMDGYIDFLGFDPQKIRELTLAAGSLAAGNLARSVFSVGAGVASNVRNDINNAADDIELTDTDSEITYKGQKIDKNILQNLDKDDIMNIDKVMQDYETYSEKYPDCGFNYFMVDYKLKQMGIKNGVALRPVFKRAYILPDETSKEPYHIMHRMVERNMTDDNLEEYMRNAKVMFVQWQGQRQVFYSPNGVVVITKTNNGWIYKTAWTDKDRDGIDEKIMEVINKYV